MHSPPFQFSLRSLFWLTAVVAVVLGTMTALGQTHNFRALGSVHALVALVPIAAVWLAWQTKLLDGRRLGIASIALYATSLVLPSLRWDDDSPMFGFAAAYSSFVGSTFHPFNPEPEPPDPLSRFLSRLLQIPEFDARDWIACCMGFFANVLYLLIMVWMIFGRPSLRSRKYFTGSALLLSVLLTLPLGLSTRLENIYLGYGVWVAAMLAMWLRVRDEQKVTSDQVPP